MRYGWIGLIVRGTAAGLAVASVDAGSPAEHAGVHPGDLVLAWGGTPTPTVGAAWSAPRVLVGDEIELQLHRGMVKLVAATLDPREVQARLGKQLGLEVVDGAGRAAVVVRVARGSIGERIGLRPGGRHPAAGLARNPQRRRLLGHAGRPAGTEQDVVLLVGRGPFAYYVTITF